MEHKPVVGAVGLVGDGGVLSVSDQPGEVGVGEESDVLLVVPGDVGAAGVEISQEHHVLKYTESNHVKKQRSRQETTPTMHWETS